MKTLRLPKMQSLTKTTRAMLLLGAAGSALTLVACGADDVASPGEGTLVVSPGGSTSTGSTSTGGTTTSTSSGGTGTGPAASCPQGTVDRGLIATNFRNCELSGRISSDVVIQNLPGVRYSLSGPVNVGTDVGGDGAAAGGQRVTLTIQAGTVIFASSGNDYLVVNRGSRLQAIGTANNPIVFTARANIEGTTTDTSQGLWGGVILLGRAPISDCNAQVAGGSAQCQNVIEGTTGSLYGGDQAADNSGTMQYVQIRYSGFAIAPGNELQGLTLGGVGSATTLDHIQIHNSSDDGIEIFGGRANLKYLVFTGADDDGLDTDVGYQGFVQFLIAAQRPDGQNGDSMVEADSNGNEDALPRQNTRLANFTFLQRSTVQGLNALLLRGGTDYTMVNGVVVGARNCLDIDETGGTTTRAADAALQDAGPPVFNSVVFSCQTPFRDDGNVATSTIQTIFGSGTNNNANFTSTLTNGYVNGPNEAAVPAFNAASLNPMGTNFFVSTTYIGAVRDAQDTWYAGWTCNSTSATFATSSPSCAAAPVTQ